MRIKENAAILDPSDAFEKKNNTLSFSIRRCSEKCNFLLFFLIFSPDWVRFAYVAAFPSTRAVTIEQKTILRIKHRTKEAIK